MCFYTITTYYTCSHTTYAHTPCEAYDEPTNTCTRRSPDPASRFLHRFKPSKATAEKQRKPPITEKALYRTIGAACGGCTSVLPPPPPPTRRVHPEDRLPPPNTCPQPPRQRTGNPRPQDEATRERLIWSKCAEAKRRVGVLDREFNSGLCCANGVDEWEAIYPQVRVYRTPPPPPKHPLRSQPKATYQSVTLEKTTTKRSFQSPSPSTALQGPVIQQPTPAPQSRTPVVTVAPTHSISPITKPKKTEAPVLKDPSTLLARHNATRGRRRECVPLDAPLEPGVHTMAGASMSMLPAPRPLLRVRDERRVVVEPLRVRKDERFVVAPLKLRGEAENMGREVKEVSWFDDKESSEMASRGIKKVSKTEMSVEFDKDMEGLQREIDRAIAEWSGFALREGNRRKRMEGGWI